MRWGARFISDAAVGAAFVSNGKTAGLQQGIRPESAPAIIALITQGSLPRNEIKTFTGLTPRPAIDELSRLIKVGLVESRTPKSRIVPPGLPAWFAQDIFPDLHRRFQ
ncbi:MULTISPECIES: hypothetical protein [unclassified Pseudomonas]|uniref:hypothetical protein n=1 Tax=unclassified Pseudomonas TaxID=196821 RepID=UPI000AB2FDDE|nr:MULTISPECIES: hypothetical protein [unclassified Pseudomonas]